MPFTAEINRDLLYTRRFAIHLDKSNTAPSGFVAPRANNDKSSRSSSGFVVLRAYNDKSSKSSSGFVASRAYNDKSSRSSSGFVVLRTYNDKSNRSSSGFVALSSSRAKCLPVSRRFVTSRTINGKPSRCTYKCVLLIKNNIINWSKIYNESLQNCFSYVNTFLSRT